MSDYTTGSPATSGPKGDGSSSLARESKIGQAINFVTTTLALAASGWLTSVKLDSFPGWATATVSAAIGTAVGLLTAYATKNRTGVPLRRTN